MEGTLRYNRVARLLHWAMASLIIFNLLAGLFHDALDGIVRLIPVHKATGILILTLTLVRIGWRLTHRPPPLPAETAAWERGAAHAVHLTLYSLMLAMPISGWIMSSASANPISFYGLFDVPKFVVTRSDSLWSTAHEGHEVLGLIMLALVVLHIAAALRHHFILKDHVLRRMA